MATGATKVLINVNITDITDESGYIEAIGKKAASEAIQRARGDVADEQKKGEIRVAEAERDQAVEVAEHNKLKQIGKLSEDVSGFVAQIPIDSHGVSLYSNDILTLHKNIENQAGVKKERQYNRFLDKLPYKIIIDNKSSIKNRNAYKGNLNCIRT